jgi:hypothetical protein
MKVEIGKFLAISPMVHFTAYQRLEMVGGTGVVSDREVVATVGQTSLLAVLVKGARGTVVTLVVAEDAIGTSRVELKGEKD